MQETNQVYNASNEALNSPLSKQEQRIIKQARRIKHICDSSQAFKRAKEDELIRKGRIISEVHDSLQALRKNDLPSDGNHEVIEHMLLNCSTMEFNPFKLKRAYDRNMKLVDHLQNNESKNRVHTRRNELNEACSHKQISKILKNNAAAPMDALRRPHDNGDDKPKGSLATDHDEIDQILIKIWKELTDGAEGTLEDTASAFIAKYDKYIVKLPEFPLEELKFEDFCTSCRVSTTSASGMDGWAPKDLASLVDKALKLTVDMLNEIEKGAEWPSTIKTTRAVFLSKDPNDTQNPLAYRILKVASAIYSRWTPHEPKISKNG